MQDTADSSALLFMDNASLSGGAPAPAAIAQRGFVYNEQSVLTPTADRCRAIGKLERRTSETRRHAKYIDIVQASCS